MLKYIIIATAKLLEPLFRLETECEENGVKLYYGLPEEQTLIDETLYITDHEEIARQLLEEKANVLVWLHEENKTKNFRGIPYAAEALEEIDFTYLERIYRRFRKLPWNIAETKRCRIREMTEEDLDAIYEIYSGENITKYMEGLYEDSRGDQASDSDMLRRSVLRHDTAAAGFRHKSGCTEASQLEDGCKNYH